MQIFFNNLSYIQRTSADISVIHLLRRLLLSLLDDLLNAADEELIHLVSSFVGEDSNK